MTPCNRIRSLALAGLVALVALTGCAAQGVNERLARGYSAVSYSRDAAGVLLDARAISSAEAQQVQDQADNGRAALDITRAIAESGDLATAEAKLQATMLALDGLRTYLELLQRKELAGDE